MTASERIRAARASVGPTGHVLGATYKSAYWSYTYKVVAIGAPDESWVTVRMIEDPHSVGRIGEVWTHRTSLDKRDERLH